MNPFDHITATLLTGPVWPFVKGAFTAPEQRPISKTERMRAYLRQHGAANAATLADEAEVPSAALVSALFKGDMARGSVYRVGHKYHWNHQFDLEQNKRITEAANLLRSHGYTVEKGLQ